MKLTKTKYSDMANVQGEDLLWDQFKKGDKAAYEYFYSQYASLLFRYGCKLVPDRELVKDVIHDLFTEMWRNKARLGAPVSVKNYLIKSVRNKLLRQLSTNLKFAGEDALSFEEPSLTVPSPEAELIQLQLKNERERQLIRALKKLTARQKEIIFLLYYNNLSPIEVAAIMSVSVRTIYNTTFNAIQALKGEMAVVALLVLLKDSPFLW